MLRFQGVDAITFDFFNTLVHHRSGNGRGADVLKYLHRHGLECDAWEHQILYDVFEAYGREYSTRFTAAQKEQYLIHLTERLFQRLHVSGGAEAASAHAIELWKLIGPS